MSSDMLSAGFKVHIEALQAICGPKGSITDAAEMIGFVTEWRDKYVGETPIVLMPSTTQQVADIICYCNKHQIPVVPQGGNTGLVGGGIPGLGNTLEVLLSTKRLNLSVNISKDDSTLTCGAGCIIQQLQDAADRENFLFPLSLASDGSCTAGGVVSTNAGGMHVIRYGTVRDFLVGVEAVLPDGSIINELSPLKKDNTGYRLSPLIAGAEGTLGIVTKASFRLSPKERTHATGWLAVPSIEAALELLVLAKNQLGNIISVFEVMHRDAIGFVLKHMDGARNPLSENPAWSILIEIASNNESDDIANMLENVLTAALEADVIMDGAIAQSDQQRSAFWSLRENISEAQKLEGGSIKHDISVPVANIPAFVHEATAAIEAMFPASRVTPFGHLGDGNLHFNVMQPEHGNKDDFLAGWEEMNTLVHDIVVAYGGSISAEHGIGIMKREELERTKGKAELQAMRAIKQALDPKGIMNPRCLF